MLLSSPERGFASANDRAQCRSAIRSGSRSFHAASLLLPRRVREPAYGLYAFCRLSDDAVDIEGGSLLAVERLRERLVRACEGRPLPIAADRALADVLTRFAIPRAAPEALLEGLAWDAQGRRYEDLTDLLDYAARVAGSVGVMMALVMGVRDANALARAGDLGVAMQLTNIARDVGEDARAGRLYLPLSWLRESGIDASAFLAGPVLSAPLLGVIMRLLATADQLYARALTGVAALPADCRTAILGSAYLYADIGRQIERLGLDPVARRSRVSGRRKAQLLARALVVAPWLKGGAPAPALTAIGFLIQAVEVSPPAPAPATRPIWSVRRQFLKALVLFERLERAEQFGD